MFRNLFVLILLCVSSFLNGQCDITSITYNMPDCNLEGQTITVNWTATCPDELMRINFKNFDTNQLVQNALNIPNTGTYEFTINNYSLVDGNYRFYIDYYPGQEDWLNGAFSYHVNDHQISVLEQFYNATNGDNWTNNTDWFSDCDPCGMTSGTSWYGLTCNGSGDITKIDLSNNNLTGSYANDVGSNLADHLCDLPLLKHVDFSNNMLTGEIPGCLFSTKDTIKLNDNMLSGGIPEDIKFANPNLVLDVSNNNLTECYDNGLNPRCSFVNLSNATVSDGNSFEADWEDFCANGKGVCCEFEAEIDLALVENGSYYASNKIVISGMSSSTTDITLNAPKVIVQGSDAFNVFGSEIEINGGGCVGKGGMNFMDGAGYLQNTNYTFPDDFTLTLWFNTSADHSSYEGRIFNTRGVNRFEIGIQDDTGKFWMHDTSTSKTSSLAYNDGEWHHVIVRNEGANADFYVDGEYLFSSDQGNDEWSNGFLIGRWPFSNIAHYIGSFADLRIYDDALDLESVIQEYECALYENNNSLDLHYSFSEGIPNGDNTSITTIVDDTGNGNDANIVGMTLSGSVSNFVDVNEIGPLECCNQGFDIVCYFVIVALDPMTGEVVVDATSFDESTELNCGDGYSVSFTADGLTSNMTYDCNDVGTIMLTIYYLSDDGLLVDSCDTMIEIQDNDDICG